MPYLIDGNNVIGVRDDYSRDKSQARRDLLLDLEAFVAAKRVTLTVVFDGAPDPLFPDGSEYGGFLIYYALYGSDADTRIKQLVEAERQPRTLIVVTSDRDLGDYVRRCGAGVTPSPDFAKRIRDCRRHPKHLSRQERRIRAEKAISQEQATLATWLTYFGLTPEEAERRLAATQPSQPQSTVKKIKPKQAKSVPSPLTPAKTPPRPSAPSVASTAPEALGDWLRYFGVAEKTIKDETTPIPSEPPTPRRVTPPTVTNQIGKNHPRRQFSADTRADWLRFFGIDDEED